MNLVEQLRASAAARPDQAAIVETRAGIDNTMTFAELWQQSGQAAALLQGDGIGRGDRVLFLAPMSIDLYVWLIGVFRVGAAAMFVDPSAGRAHVARSLSRLAPGAFVGTWKAHLLRLVIRELARVPVKYCLGGWVPGASRCSKLQQVAPEEKLCAVAGSDTALITFTSGSTGAPKVIARSHQFLLAQHQVLEKTLDLQPGKIDLATLPIFLLANLASGLTSVIPDADLRKPGAIDGQPVLAQMTRLGVYSSASSPAFAQRLCDAADATTPAALPLRKLFVGGGPVFPAMLERAQRLIREGSVVAVYGSSEAEPIAHVSAAEISPADYLAMRQGAGLLAGHPVPEIDLRILPDQWGSPVGPYSRDTFTHESLGQGEVGEIVVCGGHVVGGYLDGLCDAETKFDVDRHRWHRTGDLGRLDEQGRLWLLGRCSAKIADSRGTLYPFAIECAARQNAALRGAAICEVAGLRVLVVEFADRMESTTELEKNLAWAKLDRILPVAQIPLDTRHNAKVDYPALLRLVESLLKEHA